MHSSRGDYNASREHLLQCVERMRIDLDIPDEEFFKAIGIPEDHYRVLTTYRGKGFKLENLHEMLNGLERFSMNDDRKLTVETFKLKYGFDPILLNRVGFMELSIRCQNALAHRVQCKYVTEPVIYLGQLISYSAGELLRLPNFGPKSLRETEAQLKRFGLSLDTDPLNVGVYDRQTQMYVKPPSIFPLDANEIERLLKVIPNDLYDLNERLINEKL